LYQASKPVCACVRLSEKEREREGDRDRVTERGGAGGRAFISLKGGETLQKDCDRKARYRQIMDGRRGLAADDQETLKESEERDKREMESEIWRDKDGRGRAGRDEMLLPWG
jgi:hypothetical protein